MKRTMLIAVLSLVVGGWIVAAQEPVPGGPRAGAPADVAPIEPAEEPVVGQMEHAGWGLVGARGRHYFFGGLAVADYAWQGQRQIVTLQQEEPSLLPKPDENFLYYRELGAGHRWAVGRHPLADDSYVIYFQPATLADAADGARPKWTVFHRAQLIQAEALGPNGAGPQTTSAACNPAPR